MSIFNEAILVISEISYLLPAILPLTKCEDLHLKYHHSHTGLLRGVLLYVK